MKLRKYILYVLFAILMSCSKKDNVKFTSNFPEEYEVNYSKDTIKIVFKHLKSKTIDTLIYAKMGNDFFEVDKKNSKKLFFSTSKDTLYSINDGSFLYKTKIKKNKDLSFKTSTILVNDLGKEVILSSFYYDKDYRILKIEKQQATIIFLPQTIPLCEVSRL
ncbi:hypothetical protein [Kaistella yonginensis]|uniref:hypothetical protein n=1 Tax=Kaistella yonginensis TaxID=658267 RepID=UPI0025B4DAF9|nr:hypothetical protein [Kaistella yonginensis]MDN3606368.1 hypothetical protein [Kaistella yonginensis]